MNTNIMMDFKIGIIGCSSVGKTTLINNITDYNCQYYNIVPIDYNITNDNHQKLYIREKQVLNHNISIDNFFWPFDKNLKILVYEIPKYDILMHNKEYKHWIINNILTYNIIIYMADITKEITHYDEEILGLLMELAKKNCIEIICLLNKCDNIYYDNEQNDIFFKQKNDENAYLQANDILYKIGKKHDIKKDAITFTPFIPITSKDWIISNPEKSRNEHLFDTGYISLKNILQNKIEDKMAIIIRHINNIIIEAGTVEKIIEKIEIIKKYIDLIPNDLNCKPDNYIYLWDNIREIIAKWYNNIMKLMRENDIFKSFEKFDELYSKVQSSYISYGTIYNTIKKIPEFPSSVFKSIKSELINTILESYDQIIQQFNIKTDSFKIVYILPPNLLQYLQFITAYKSSKACQYSIIFLKIIANMSWDSIKDYQNDLIDFTQVVLNNIITYGNNIYTDILTYYELISKIILNKASFIKQNKMYLMQLIKIIDNARENLNKINIDKSPNNFSKLVTPLDILYEIIKTQLYRELLKNNHMAYVNDLPSINYDFEYNILNTWDTISSNISNINI